MPSVLRFHDRDWRTVNVQIRQGNDPVPEKNRSLGTVQLNLDQTYDVVGDENVWYRRDANPDNPDGSWTMWTLRVIYGPPAAPQDLTEELG
jgi:hypothetical protein